MNGTWHEMISVFGTTIPTLSHLTLAQDATANPFNLGNYTLGSINLVDIGISLLILLVGYLIALFAQSLVKSLLKKTDFDNKIASWVTGRSDGGENIPVENWVGTAVFWIIFLFAIIGFLERLQLTAASTPLTTLLNEITIFFPRILAALILLGIAWVVATVCKAVTVRILNGFRVDERLNQQVNDGTTQADFSLSETFGNAIYWFIFLLFLLPVLDTLSLQGLLAPVQQMLNQVLFILPNILAAILIAAAGWVIAQIVRRIVTNLLIAVGTDRLGRRFGLGDAANGQSLSSIIGTVVYVLILIPIAIAALNALKIEAISVPAIEMLSRILNIIPQLFAAGVILAVAYVIGRFVSDLVTSVLTSFGFNRLFYWLGLQSTPPHEETVVGTDHQVRVVDTTSPSTTRTPSEIVGIIAFVGIMLFAIVTATDILQLTSLTLILEQIILIAGRVLIGVVIFAVGLYFANLAHRLVLSSGTGNSKLLAQAARVAIIIFVGAMALQQMGIGSDIVNLAFGLLLGAIAVAVAISFGLGGRDIAAEKIRETLSKVQQK
ncbi:mechanosensitive ion channel [Limnoraphis robusta Tam1]|uniref:Mechanosensitive ion channel n=1 Tax=Limnoraphis robusta CCNP1315 TaxID=3110306 RepID=A0ABU5U7S6_9CYAN|nr:mechanosensitive ion channel [Limnoraphis robusta]MEA5499074.1 mechanosensitive ion channel [Limnoraphis robusta BA-68 BA1]MEA5523253.1 mechanosensitive ion channel [Limnoraphis robusta CCNP1315]MEA5543331.1 mechanosensitive ion channel [Limnoraphis robusta Tam1]MEA5544374.1 mechanosensitive ion channel [Limnoraphis robusta CCNP1324]